MVIGNKCDLENARVVSIEQGQSFADGHGFKFMETSASDNMNVNEVRKYSLNRNTMLLYYIYLCTGSCSCQGFNNMLMCILICYVHHPPFIVC